MIKFKVLDSNKDQAILMEELRLKAYGIKNPSKESLDPEYIKDICSGKILVFTCLLNNQIVAGCYVSDSLNSIYIDYIFVLPEYQEKGMHLGENLLKFILDNKTLVDQYFNKSFNQSKLCAVNPKSKIIYQRIGYCEETSPSDILCKKLF